MSQDKPRAFISVVSLQMRHGQLTGSKDFDPPLDLLEMGAYQALESQLAALQGENEKLKERAETALKEVYAETEAEIKMRVSDEEKRFDALKLLHEKFVDWADCNMVEKNKILSTLESQLSALQGENEKLREYKSCAEYGQVEYQQDIEALESENKTLKAKNVLLIEQRNLALTHTTDGPAAKVITEFDLELEEIK